MEQSTEVVYKNRMIILINVVLMTFMATLDSSIVNVALPEMSKHLSVSTEAIAWVVTSYLLVIVGTILVFGRLGDLKGKTRVFQLGIVIFTLGSLLCGISNSFIILIIARGIQGLGAAATMATNQGIITHVFPSNERGRALGISGTFVALGSLAGPPLGGVIVDALNWKFIFLINVPIGIIVYLLGIKILPRTKNISSEKLDVKGATLFAVSIVSLFMSLILGEEQGYQQPIILAGFLLFLITFIVFIVVEKRTEVPLLQLSLFKNRLFTLSIFCAFTSFIAISSSTIIMPFYLQYTKAYSPLFTGLILMVYPLILAVVAPVSGYLSDKIGSEFLTFVGLSLNAVGLFLMSTLHATSSLIHLILFVALMSIGNGLFQSPNNSLIMSNAPTHMLGISGSINALIRNLGMISGISIAVLILYGRMSHKIGYKVSDYVTGRDDVFIYGMKGAYLTAACICLFGAVLTAIRLINRRRANSES
ncbi:MAG: drug resistance transporter, EmrB/QacA subfamily [Herbinix sp.]|jgi:EmrB/QacA subfamily drug resistance transporter|nr:drug resistance transporter, EmrB/QacA subfamily [Herbinix sp.]